MTIGTILPDIIAGCGITVSDNNVNSGDKHMRQIASLMNQSGQDIVKRAEWSRNYGHVDIGASVTEITLPADFYKLAETGVVSVKEEGGFEPIRTVVEPATWAFIKDQTSEQRYCHIEAGKLYFTPDAGPEGSRMTYVKKGWLASGSEFVTDNADVPVFPESLLLSAVLWRFNRQVGLPYDDLAAEFEANFTAAINADRGMA